MRRWVTTLRYNRSLTSTGFFDPAERKFLAQFTKDAAFQRILFQAEQPELFGTTQRFSRVRGPACDFVGPS
jgi:hypothetical protein